MCDAGRNNKAQKMFIPSITFELIGVILTSAYRPSPGIQILEQILVADAHKMIKRFVYVALAYKPY